MGVSGCGKTTVGEALAGRLGVPFADADDFHPRANIDKMSRGEPLDDGDRRPWLDAIGRWLGERPDGAVASCSALKRTYRDQLRGHADELSFLHLTGDRELLARRQAGRPGHFMPASLLDSQLATLEPLGPDEQGLTVDIDRSVDAIVAAYVGPPGSAGSPTGDRRLR